MTAGRFYGERVIRTDGLFYLAFELNLFLLFLLNKKELFFEATLQRQQSRPAIWTLLIHLDIMINNLSIYQTK